MSFDKPRLTLGQGPLNPEQIERLNAMLKFGLNKSFDTWRLVVDISGHLDGEIEDWPARIANPIHKCMEDQCIPKPGEHVKIVAARCYRDAPDENSYIAVVVQAFPNFILN